MEFTDETGVNPVENAERVRRLRGMAPINPNRIEGPADDPMPDFTNPYPPSPLIPQAPTQTFDPGSTTTQAAQVQQMAQIPTEGIVIFYHGQRLEPDGRVALKIEEMMLEQVIQASKARLQMLKPRRGAVSVKPSVAPAPTVAAPPSPAIRKRGRPKGSKNRPKVTDGNAAA